MVPRDNSESILATLPQCWPLSLFHPTDYPRAQAVQLCGNSLLPSSQDNYDAGPRSDGSKPSYVNKTKVKTKEDWPMFTCCSRAMGVVTSEGRVG